MEIIKLKIDAIDLAPYNPRKNLKPGDPEYEKLKRSIQEFSLVEPLVWNRKTERLVGGHQRLKILRELGYTEVEVSVVDLPEEREKALNIALNKIQGDWDEEKLAELLDELNQKGLAELAGFDGQELTKLLQLEDKPSPYTYKVEAVQYEPKGNPALEELVDKTKYEELLREIDAAGCGEDVKIFLRLAATRFLRFNYAKIADFYANAEPETQKLFEVLALVIIDFEDAIAKGFVRFSKQVAEMFDNEYENKA